MPEVNCIRVGKEVAGAAEEGRLGSSEGTNEKMCVRRTDNEYQKV